MICWREANWAREAKWLGPGPSMCLVLCGFMTSGPRGSPSIRVQSSRYRGETEAQRGQTFGLSFYRLSWLVSPRLPSLPLLHSASWGSLVSYASRGQACLYPPSPPWCACPAQRRYSRGTADIQDMTGQSCPSTVHEALNPERAGRNPVQFRKSGPHFQLPAGWWRRG